MDVLCEVPARCLACSNFRKFTRWSLNQFGDVFLNLLPNLRILQRRQYFWFLNVCETAAQRTFHQIVIYHCHPPGRISLSVGLVRTTPCSCGSLQSLGGWVGSDKRRLVG